MLAATTFLALGAASPASAVTISATYDTVSLTATPATVSVGDTVTVSAVFTGLVDAYAYELDIAYDAKRLAFIDDSEQLPSGGFDSVTDREARSPSLPLGSVLHPVWPAHRLS